MQYKITSTYSPMMCMQFDYMLTRDNTKYSEYWAVQIENNNCTTTITGPIDEHRYKKYSIAKKHLDEFEIGNSYPCWRHETKCRASWTSSSSYISVNWINMIIILAYLIWNISI